MNYGICSLHTPGWHMGVRTWWRRAAGGDVGREREREEKKGRVVRGGVQPVWVRGESKEI
jgi:hypothetical protein